MERKRALIVLIGICILTLSEDVVGGDERWITYSSDRSVTQECDLQSIEQGSDVVRTVDVRISGKPGSKTFKNIVKFYIGKGSCTTENLDTVRSLLITVQFICGESKYRVLGGAIRGNSIGTLCEPDIRYIEWIVIPRNSPIEVLNRVVCGKK
jgi:hypothetical protein